MSNESRDGEYGRFLVRLTVGLVSLVLGGIIAILSFGSALVLYIGIALVVFGVMGILSAPFGWLTVIKWGLSILFVLPLLYYACSYVCGVLQAWYQAWKQNAQVPTSQLSSEKPLPPVSLDSAKPAESKQSKEDQTAERKSEQTATKTDVPEEKKEEKGESSDEERQHSLFPTPAEAVKNPDLVWSDHAPCLFEIPGFGSVIAYNTLGACPGAGSGYFDKNLPEQMELKQQQLRTLLAQEQLSKEAQVTAEVTQEFSADASKQAVAEKLGHDQWITQQLARCRPEKGWAKNERETVTAALQEALRTDPCKQQEAKTLGTESWINTQVKNRLFKWRDKALAEVKAEGTQPLDKKENHEKRSKRIQDSEIAFVKTIPSLKAVAIQENCLSGEQLTDTQKQTGWKYTQNTDTTKHAAESMGILHPPALSNPKPVDYKDSARIQSVQFTDESGERVTLHNVWTKFQEYPIDLEAAIRRRAATGGRHIFVGDFNGRVAPRDDKTPQNIVCSVTPAIFRKDKHGRMLGQGLDFGDGCFVSGFSNINGGAITQIDRILLDPKTGERCAPAPVPPTEKLSDFQRAERALPRMLVTPVLDEKLKAYQKQYTQKLSKSERKNPYMIVRPAANANNERFIGVGMSPVLYDIVKKKIGNNEGFVCHQMKEDEKYNNNPVTYSTAFVVPERYEELESIIASSIAGLNAQNQLQTASSWGRLWRRSSQQSSSHPVAAVSAEKPVVEQSMVEGTAFLID